MKRIDDFPADFSVPIEVVLKVRYEIKSHTFEIPIPLDLDCVGLQFADPIALTPGDISSLPDEIEIERQGASCSRCGFCCGVIDKKLTDHACRHVDKKGVCEIYDHLEDFCSDCGTDHSTCVPAPHFPYSKGICSYKWIVITPGLVITGAEVSRFFFVPKGADLSGRWIR